MKLLKIFSKKNNIENNNFSKELEEQRHNSEEYIYTMNYLDNQGIPRGDAKGEYTLIHRFSLLEQKNKFNN